MTRAARSPRGRLLALSLTMLALAASVPLATTADAAPAADGSVTLTIIGVTPTTPNPATPGATLTVSFRLHNNTDQALTAVQVSGARGNPIQTQAALDSEIAHPTVPDPGLVSPIASPPIPVDLAADGTEDGVFTTTTGTQNHSYGICLCLNAIYPLYFSATIIRDGNTTTLGTAQTYIPAFDVAAPTKLRVAWLWPLLDRPHRLTSSTVFLDDGLADEVAPGGRLDRALSVVEHVTAALPTAVPMTLVTDPDLIDELEVMATGTYTVQSGKDPPVSGVGSADAALWLARLRAVLTSPSGVELDFTAYGDPDVEALHHNGLTWTSGVPASVAAQISTALGGVTPFTDLDWPAGETLGPRTLDAVVAQGEQTVVLNDKTVPGIVGVTTDSLARIATTSGTATMGVLDSSIQTWATKVFTANGGALVALPEFIAEVALHAVNIVDVSHTVLIAPPRELNVNPIVATQAILDTTTGVWATPTTLRGALHAQVPRVASKVVDQPGVPLVSAATLHYVADSLTGLATLFSDANRPAQIGEFRTAAQLAASSSLLRDSDQNAATNYANPLSALVAHLRGGVHLVLGTKHGSYTLTSTNSSIPITIANDFAVPVTVHVSGSAVGGLSGFAATPISKSIPASSKIQVRLPTHFDRTGRIEVQVTLATPSSLQLGDPLQLSVRSTALGTIGIVITTVAGVVLIVALLVRVVGRVRRERRKKVAA